ncbi:MULTISPECIES: hypothetical protein [unclassified Microcoleus]|uniref:hypothetical protein n=1 Tax=unclassified Microcoleus TaxID=2642155 RepID=UPI002FD2EF96
MDRPAGSTRYSPLTRGEPEVFKVPLIKGDARGSETRMKTRDTKGFSLKLTLMTAD